MSRNLTVDLGGGAKLEMVLIPAGEFMMGSRVSDKEALDDEYPRHRVRITKPFYLGKYPVTQEQWCGVMGDLPQEHWYSVMEPKNPVEYASWDDCQEFVKELNAKAGGGRFTLPTEAQWEYACRAGSKTRYCFGDDAAGLWEYGWYAGHGTHPVGEKKPNAWGLYDMHGNVSEWCADWDGDYAEGAVDDPTGPSDGSLRVSRGGSWFCTAWRCRSAYRDWFDPRNRARFLGFRLALVPSS